MALVADPVEALEANPMSTPIPGTDPAAVPAAPEQPAPTTAGTASAPEAPQYDESALPEWAQEKLRKANREAQGLRTRLHESEPLVQEAIAARDAQKTEAQRATERADALANQLAETQLLAERNGLAAQFAIPADYHAMIVGASAEERAQSAAKIAKLLQAQAVPATSTPAAPGGPPMGKPVEQLQSGASPTPPSPPPTEYPAHWTPHLKRKE